MTMKRILVSIPQGAWELINRHLKGKMGDKDSEIVRNIVLAYLSEKGYMKEELHAMPAPMVAQVAAEEKKDEKRGRETAG